MTAPVIRSVAALAALYLVSTLAAPALRAEDSNAAMPQTLVVGYDEEGKIDASVRACRAFVVDTVEWDAAATEQAVRDVCAYRQKHVEAYGAFQAAYAGLRDVLQEQVRFEGMAAARHLAGVVKSCIDLKWSLSTGGHNIGLDMVPNAIAAECLVLGRELAERETADLSPRDESMMGGE